MYRLIERCLAGEHAAWNELWELNAHHAVAPVQRLLVRAGFDPSEADDVAVEVFTGLYADGGKRLGSFHGDSQAELIAWLLRVAINTTRNWIERGWRSRRRLRCLAKRAGISDRCAASLNEVESLLSDLEVFLSPTDMIRLRQMAGLDSDIGEPGVTCRTQRYWKLDVERKVLGYLDMSGRQKARRSKGRG